MCYHDCWRNCAQDGSASREFTWSGLWCLNCKTNIRNLRCICFRHPHLLTEIMSLTNVKVDWMRNAFLCVCAEQLLIPRVTSVYCSVDVAVFHCANCPSAHPHCLDTSGQRVRADAKMSAHCPGLIQKGHRTHWSRALPMPPLRAPADILTLTAWRVFACG